ncbi:CRE-MES-3 protein [Caenorhabditis remanei]|uniref:CRE-MES-3 protein n=2 Tax=Caenorhabditis remanei TaxID=31234 RepID=E3MX50_CAERE|nr:CRE-MES-3 protein [Caenorhabditis remanei]
MRNVMRGSLVVEKKAKCKRREMTHLEEIIKTLEEEMMKEKDLHDLCCININQVKCWNTQSDTENWATDHASVQTFVLIVDDNDRVTVIDTGLSSVSLATTSLKETISCDNWKNVKATSAEINNAKHIYYAVVARRMTDKQVAKRGASRKPITSDNTHISDPSTLNQMVSAGCIRMYEKGRPNRMDNGMSRVILVEKEDSPVLEVALSTDWMLNPRHLETLHEVNVTKQDSHLPRIVFYSNSPKMGETILATTPSTPVKKPESPRSLWFKGPNGLLPKDELNWLAKDEDEAHANRRVKSRFPCYSLYNGYFYGDTAYFTDTSLRYYDDFCLYRRSRDRGIVAGRRATGRVDTTARNVGVRRRQVFGLDFVTSGAGNYFESVIYQPRRDHEAIPPIFYEAPVRKAGKKSTKPVIVLSPRPNKESYPNNNAKLFTELHFQDTMTYDIPEELRVGTSDMAVVKIKPTENFIKVWNHKLENQPVIRKSKKNKKKVVVVPPRRPNPENRPDESDRDLDGRKIPTFSQMFFPSGKTEIYDMMLRFYLSMTGIRPGSFSADFKSRLLAGFISEYSDYVFQYNLGDMFEKQVQLIGLYTLDWKKHHYDLPRDKFFELKAEWEQKQQPKP